MWVFFGHTRFKIPLSLKGQLSWNLRIVSLHLFHSFDFPVCSILWNQVTQTDTFMNMEYYYVHIVTYTIHNMSYNSDVLYHFYPRIVWNLTISKIFVYKNERLVLYLPYYSKHPSFLEFTTEIIFYNVNNVFLFNE